MHIALALAVVTTLTLAESAPPQPVSQSAARCFFALAAMAIVVWLAVVVTRGTVRALQHDFAQRTQWLRDFDRWQHIHTGLWFGVVLGIQCGLDWPQLVRVNWQLGQMVLVDDLLVLVPVVLPLLLTWAVEFDLDRAIRVGGECEPWKLRLTDRGTFVAGYARHYFVLSLVPVLALLGTRDAVQTWYPEILAGRHAWLVYLAPIATIIIAFPWVLRVVWLTERLADGSLRDRLLCCARRCDVRLRDILVWKTDGRVVNAALAGLFWPVRYVFLTDGLLQRLDDDEMEAVFFHEAGHARLHHVGQRVMAVVIPLALWQAAQGWQRTAGAGPVGPMGPLGSPFSTVSPLLPAMIVGVYLVVTLGWYSRLLEHQADLWACCYLRNIGSDDGKSRDAVTRYVRVLEKISLAHRANRRRGGWLHPSQQSRIDFLRDTALDPTKATVFHRRVLRATAIVLAGAPIALVLVLAISFPA